MFGSVCGAWWGPEPGSGAATRDGHYRVGAVLDRSFRPSFKVYGRLDSDVFMLCGFLFLEAFLLTRRKG